MPHIAFIIILGHYLSTTRLLYRADYDHSIISSSTHVYVSELNGVNIHVHNMKGKELMPPLKVTGVRPGHIIHGSAYVEDNTLLLATGSEVPRRVTQIYRVQGMIQ